MNSSLNEIVKCQNLWKIHLLERQRQLRKEKVALAWDNSIGEIPILKKSLCKFSFLSRGPQSSKERQPAQRVAQ